MFLSLTVLLCLAQAADAAQPAALIPELRPNASIEDGVVTLGASKGWLRTERPLLDFEVDFEFRALTPDAEPGLMLRTFPGMDRPAGYRLTLPTKLPKNVASLFVARAQKLVVQRVGTVRLRPVGEWQRIVVIGHGRSIRIGLNGTFLGEFEVEAFAGYLMFDNRKGRAELRNIQITSRDVTPPPSILRATEIEDAGGTMPEITKEVRPVYSRTAMAAKIEGTVVLDAVVLANGAVGPIRLKRSLHPDLDANAAAAVKNWTFHPAVLNGIPVPSLVEVELKFTLR